MRERWMPLQERSAQDPSGSDSTPMWVDA
jgi:hypothetical protein